MHPIIRVSSDRTEADFLIGHRSGRQRKRRWTVVGYRWVRFSDRKLLVGWCKGGCCTDGNRLFDLLEGIDRRAQLHTWLQPPVQCECSRRLLAKLGGAELLTELQAAAGGTTLHDGDGALISEVYLPVGGRFLAVRPAGGGFDSWGVRRSQPPTSSVTAGSASSAMRWTTPPASRRCAASPAASCRRIYAIAAPSTSSAINTGAHFKSAPAFPGKCHSVLVLQ